MHRLFPIPDSVNSAFFAITVKVLAPKEGVQSQKRKGGERKKDARTKAMRIISPLLLPNENNPKPIHGKH
jgi:hypothetical protein